MNVYPVYSEANSASQWINNGQVKQLFIYIITKCRQPGVKLRTLISLKNGHCLGSLEAGFRLCSDGASQAILSRWRSTRVPTANTSGSFFFKSKTKSPSILSTR